MQSEQLLGLLGIGPCLLVELRGQQLETIKFADKKNEGKPATMMKNQIACELVGSGMQVTLDQFSARGETKLEPLPYNRGDVLLVELDGYASTYQGRTGKVKSVHLYKSGKPLTRTQA